MISVVIPTHNAEVTLAATLASLIPSAVEGLVREVIVSDGGSDDTTMTIAEGFGATVLTAGPTRANRLIAGAAQAKFPWLLFLDADCVLEAGWEREADKFAAKIDSGARTPTAAVFRFAIDDTGVGARITESIARSNSLVFGSIHAKQALLVSRLLYTATGGFKQQPLHERVDLTNRLGRKNITTFSARSFIHSGEYNDAGYAKMAVRYYGSLATQTVLKPMERFVSLQKPAVPRPPSS